MADEPTTPDPQPLPPPPQAERPQMSDYGVDTPAWSPLPWSWAAERLVPTRNYWVVTATESGRPHALPVWGVWHDGEQRFFFSCAPSARKARNLRANPRAVVMGDDTVECISLEGTAAPVTDPARRMVWVERYLDKYRPISPSLDGEFLEANSMYEFAPERGFAVIEREDEFSTRATRWTFA